MSHRDAIVASILAADFSRLGQQMATAAEAGADRFQVDIMDGHFVPNISMGPMFVAQARAHTTLPIEAHLMVSHPEQWISAVAAAGANWIIVHAESTVHLNRCVALVREAGARPAVALNPASPLVLLEEVLPELTMVLLMTVNPGFGGQQFIPAVLDKIQRLRARLAVVNPECEIEVDGGVEADTIGLARRAGANAFVAGTAIFGHPQGIAAGVAALRAGLA